MRLHDKPSSTSTTAMWSIELLALFADGRDVHLAPGEVLFTQGDRSREVFFIVRGVVDVVLHTAEGGQRTLARLGAGEVLGELAGLLDVPRTTSVQAREATYLLALDPSALPTAARHDDPRLRFFRSIALMLADRVRASNAMLRDLLDDELDLGAPTEPMESDPEASRGLPVKVASRLTLTDLEALVDGRLLALRIPGYYTRRVCAQLCKLLLRHPAFAHYSIAPDVGVQRVGYTLFETQDHAERLGTYHALAVPTIEEIRTVCAPMLTPIDRLRLELDELWPGGAGLATLGGRKTFVGIARLFEDGHSLPPHQDVLHRDTTDPMARTLDAQLTGNLYLRIAREGGELEIWDWMPTEAEANGLLEGHHDFYARERLPPPSAVIRARVGELVLMLASRIHAVRPIRGGPRVSLSCFVGSRGKDERLVLWS